jgi:antitoxin component of RelBE/YafQ-DinJ toxin-antitoxin module
MIFSFSHIFINVPTNTNMAETKYMTFRISKKLSDTYKNMCDKQGYTPSKRIRALMELDLKLSKKNKNILINESK